MQLPDRNWVRFDFRMREFDVLRKTLRILSMWQPKRAHFTERIIYPLFVNILLLVMVAADIVMVYKHIKNPETSVQVYVILSVDLGTYFSHVFGTLYLKRRDLEGNVIDFTVSTRLAEQFKKDMRKLNYFILISFLMLVLMFFNTNIWLKGRFTCSSVFPFASHEAVCSLNYPSNIYGVGATLSISWVMYLLHLASRIKLLQCGEKYVQWKNTAEDAIFDHFNNYSQRVYKSCRELKYWFVVHNLILIIAMPLFMYTITHTFKNIAVNSIDKSLLLCYLVYTAAVWISPLVFAEWLQMHDLELNDEVNNFCKLYILEKLAADDVIQGSQEMAEYTFTSRTETNKFLSYLRGRKSGFLVGGYNFQFKLSMVSFFIGLIAFASKIVDG